MSPVSDFSKFVHDSRNCLTGRDGEEHELPFIAPGVLRKYWTPARISAIQHARDSPLPFPIDTILERYLQTFATLVYAGIVGDLQAFTSYNLDDNRLPLEKHPEEWEKSPHKKRLFSAIVKHQWKFFPLLLAPGQLEDRVLDSRRILPIKHTEQVNHGDAATISKITLHDGCSDLSQMHTFVLKTYHSLKSQQIYENELRALSMLKNSPSPHVITYYGSFQQSQTYNLILEYADRGNLADFFQKVPSPKTDDEITQFWKSLSRALEGLDRVHSLLIAVGDKRMHGIHEDIKPENILLSKGPSESPYDFVPKIADFGLFSHVRDSNSPSCDAMGFDKHGNQLYSSPECSHVSLGQQTGPNLINTRADIFSMGAVLSDACAWVFGGRAAQTKYRNARITHHQSLGRFPGSGFEGCFHDGRQRLSVVDDMHAEIRRGCRDRTTPRIIGIIEKHMLLENISQRLNARDLLKEFEQILENTDGQSTSHNGTATECVDPNTDHPANLNHTVSALSDLGMLLTVEQFVTNYKLKTAHVQFSADLQRLVDRLQTNVPDRDHFFFVDDSTSMNGRRGEVYDLLLALLTITKYLDPNKIELAFASTVHEKVYRSSKRKKLLQIADKHEYRREPHMMESSFARLIDSIIFRRLPSRPRWFTTNIFPRKPKPMSIYVFTDGNWGNGGNAGGVERPIRRLVEELQCRRLDKNQVTFHFVRFGNLEDGGTNLAYLDDSLEEHIGWDLADVKHATSPLHRIILGPISQRNDEMD